MTEKDFKTYTCYTRIRTGEFDIFMFPNTLSCCRFLRTSGSNPKYFSDYGVGEFDGVRLSTLEETHWLAECIKKDTMVPREIAMASFAKTASVSKFPAYVRCYFCDTTDRTFKKGNVYKTYPGLHIEGSVYIKRDTDGLISDYSLNGCVWKFEACEGPETTIVNTFEVFDKFNIGDIVVSLTDKNKCRNEGDIYKVLPESHSTRLYYKSDCNSSDLGDWRLASAEEANAYANGVTNIKQLDSPKETTKPIVSQFLKDDYIVVLQEEISVSFPKNHVFKQRETACYLRVYKDIRGEANGNNIADISKASLWRYATSQEIMEYDIQGKPVDVTKIGMVPKTVLPAHDHKWAVKRTVDNHLVLNYWANNQKGAYGHSKKDGWMHSINYGHNSHSGNGHFYADDTKHPDHTEITTEQFKRDIMREIENETSATNSFPLHWYLTVTEDNIWDAEMWRWEGNLSEHKLEIGSVVGMHTRYGKCHSKASADSNKEFGKEISYSVFKANIFPKEERLRLLKLRYPVGTCIVVTRPSANMNGKLDYCYKVINHGTGGDPTLYYDNNNSIGLLNVGVRRALTNEKTRYEREGKPFDVHSLESVSKYEINNSIPKYVRVVSYGDRHLNHVLCTDNPAPKEFQNDWHQVLIQCGRLADGSFVPATREDYEAFIVENERQEAIGNKSYKDKSLKEMLVICQQMFPVGCTIRFRSDPKIWTVKEPLKIQHNQFISYEGFPIVYNDDVERQIKAELITMPEISKSSIPFSTTIRWSATKQPERGASQQEILDYCKAMYPKGTYVQFGGPGGSSGIITEELYWSGNVFVSHPGAPIVYNRSTHEFATIVSYAYIENPDGSPVKTIEDLPKKAKMSDVSALIKHQEPVVVNRQKTKRSKLVTINK